MGDLYEVASILERNRIGGGHREINKDRKKKKSPLPYWRFCACDLLKAKKNPILDQSKGRKGKKNLRWVSWNT